MNYYYGNETIRILFGKYKNHYGKVIRWIPNPNGYIIQVNDIEIFLFNSEMN